MKFNLTSAVLFCFFLLVACGNTHSTNPKTLATVNPPKINATVFPLLNEKDWNDVSPRNEEGEELGNNRYYIYEKNSATDETSENADTIDESIGLVPTYALVWGVNANEKRLLKGYEKWCKHTTESYSASLDLKTFRGKDYILVTLECSIGEDYFNAEVYGFVYSFDGTMFEKEWSTALSRGSEMGLCNTYAGISLVGDKMGVHIVETSGTEFDPPEEGEIDGVVDSIREGCKIEPIKKQKHEIAP